MPPAAPIMPPDAPTAPLPAFGVPEAALAEPPPFAPDMAGVGPAGPAAAASAPEDGGPPDERTTSHLDGDEAPVAAPPVAGEAFPALQPGGFDGA